MAGLGALGACSQSSRQVTGPLVFPADPRISEVEAGRVGVGDIVDAELVNRLPVETSIHWHGVAFRNAARQRRPAGYPTSR